MRATPTLIGRPTSSRTRRRSRLGDLHRRAREVLHAAHVQEGLVDRERLHHRRGVLEDPEDRLARLGVGLHPARHDGGLGAQAPRPPGAHPAVHAAGLRLVAGREHHARRRRSPAARAATGRRAARPTRRTSRGRRGGRRLEWTRTHVRAAEDGTSGGFARAEAQLVRALLHRRDHERHVLVEVHAELLGARRAPRRGSRRPRSSAASASSSRTSASCRGCRPGARRRTRR